MPLLNVGIDLSHHNTVSSFQEVKDSGILGITHKATQGTSFEDPEYGQLGRWDRDKLSCLSDLCLRE